MKLLTLCIPTYNRSSFLQQQLKQIVSAISQYNLEALVEIQISDNASTDNTEFVIKEFADSFPQIQIMHIKKVQSVGSFNVIQVTELANYDHVWILSDDDLITIDSLHLIVKKIQAMSDSDVILINFSELRSGRLPAERVSKMPQNKDTLTFEEAHRILRQQITFISSIIFRRSLLHSIDIYKYLTSTIPAAYLFSDCLHLSKKTVFIDAICLLTRPSNSGGYNFFKVYITEFFEYSRYLGAISANKQLEKYFQFLALRFAFIKVFEFKVYGKLGNLTPDFSDAKRRLRMEIGNSPTYFLFSFIITIPNTLFKASIAIFRWARSFDRKIRGL